MDRHADQPVPAKHMQPVQQAIRLISCPHCNTLVHTDDVNLGKGIATCHNCDHVFSMSDDFFSPDPVTGHTRPELLIPDGLEVLALRSELEVLINWRRALPKSNFSFVMLFTLIWNLVLLPFVFIIFGSGNYHILPFLSLHLIVGISMLYYLFGIFLNTTTIRVTSKQLRITTHPLRMPFRKKMQINSRDIRQLYVTKYVSSRTNGKPNFAYALYAVLSGGKKISLVKGMNFETQQYLEHAIERFLHIEDKYVDGEEEKKKKGLEKKNRSL